MYKTLVFIATYFLTSSAIAQELKTFICSSNYNKPVSISKELDKLPLEANEDLTTLKLTVIPSDEGITSMNVENLTESESSVYFCFQRSNFPNLREPPTTYSCASELTQLFFNSGEGTLLIMEPFVATVGLPTFPLLKAECTEDE